MAGLCHRQTRLQRRPPASAPASVQFPATVRDWNHCQARRPHCSTVCTVHPAPTGQKYDI